MNPGVLPLPREYGALPRLAVSSRVQMPGGTVYDADAATYIASVESADGQQLEPPIRAAIHEFVAGLKTDGTWSAIKSAAIMCGARTLSGALKPLVGTAVTNTNFVSGDYSRRLGLKGNASNKYLNTNRNNNADPNDSCHQSLWITEPGAAVADSNRGIIGAGVADVGATAINAIYNIGSASHSDVYYVSMRNRSNGQTALNTGAIDWATDSPIGGVPAIAPVLRESGFVAHTRNQSRHSGFARMQTRDMILAPSTAFNQNVFVFGRNTTSLVSHRLSWYSVGTHVDLQSLRRRVTVLMESIQAVL